MNYLQLARRTAQECGVASGTAITAALPTVVGATGSLGRICNWVNDGWGGIQGDREDWDWMRSSALLGGGVSFQTVAGQARYMLATGPGDETFRAWAPDTFRSYPTAVGVQGEMALEEIPYDVWRDGYMMGALRTVQTRPVVIAIGPDQSLCLGPPPTDQYTITADYFTAPTDLVADTDVPAGLPSRFHMLIVYRAMMQYAGYESAPEVYERGSREAASLYAQLQAVRAPRISFAGALA